MKKLLNFLTVFLMAVSISHAQEHEMHCMIYKLPEQYLIQNSSLIVRAEVLSKVSEWDASKSNIFSYYRLKVYEDFTGNAPTFVTLVSEGGQVGNDEMQFGDRIDLTVGEEVIVLLNQVPQHWKGIRREANSYASWTSIQGLFRIDGHTEAMHDVFDRYENLDAFRARVSNLTGRNPIVLQPKARITNNPPAAGVAATVSGVSPTIVTAGTKTVLTITGSGFGATRGNGFVEFRSIFEDGSFGRPLPKDYLFWSDTEIRVHVPSILTNVTGDSPAATGPVRVTPNGGVAAQSAGNITVSYALFNVKPTTSDSAYVLVAGNFNALGAYTLQFNDQFNTTFGTTARQTIERCFTKWRCATGFNWTLSASATTVRATNADGVNVITDDVQTPLPAGIGGRAINRVVGCGSGITLKTITNEQDIIINNDPSTGTSTYSWNFGSGNPTLNQFDFETVMLHEIGHTHQITHTLHSSATEVMASTVTNGVAKKNLFPNDIAAGLDVVNRSSVSVGCGASPLSTSLPNITINNTSDLPVCANGSASFLANTNNTASTSALVWRVNGVDQTSSIGSTGFTYTNPQNNAVITCGIAGCSNTVSNAITVSVTPLPSATFSYPASNYCKSFTSAINPTITGAPGGTFTSSPAGLSINATTGAINAAASTAGTYTVTRSVTASGCTGFATFTMTISEAAYFSMSYSTPYCKSTIGEEGPVTIGTTGGTFSASPAGLSLNATSGVFTPSTSVAGTYSITYTVAATATCGSFSTSVNVTITTAPSASINYSSSSFCRSTTTSVPCTITGATGGTFTSSPSGLSLNSSTGAIVPSSSTAGTYTVTYTVAGGGGCGPFTTTRTVIIVNQLSTPGAISGATTNSCGITRTYSIASVAGATNYTWTLPSGATGSSTTTSISVTFTSTFTSGVISVRANALNGCNSNLRSITVYGKPAAPGSITITNVNIATGTGTASIAAVQGASSYTWTITNGIIQSGQGTTSISVKKNIGVNSITVCVKANSNCGSSAQTCRTYFYSLAAPLEDQTELAGEAMVKNDIQFSYPTPTVFPNPATDFVNLKFDEIWFGTEVTAYLMNIEGKIVREFSFVPSSEEMQQTDVSGLMPGMYMMRLQTADNYQTIRFIKQ